MPQLDKFIFFNQFFWFCLFFFFFYFFTLYIILPLIFKILKFRLNKINFLKNFNDLLISKKLGISNQLIFFLFNKTQFWIMTINFIDKLKFYLFLNLK